MPNPFTFIIAIFRTFAVFLSLIGLEISGSIICPLRVAMYPTTQTQQIFDATVKLLGSLNNDIVFIKKDFSKPECRSVPFGTHFEKPAEDILYSTNLSVSATHDIFDKSLSSGGWIHDQDNDRHVKNNGQFVSLYRVYKKKIYFRDFTLDLHFSANSPQTPNFSGSVSLTLREI